MKKGSAGGETENGDVIGGAAKVPVTRITKDGRVELTDLIVIEEPLEIRLAWGPAEDRTHQAVSVTMRTPGRDEDLAAGFLFTEGILRDAGLIAQIAPCGEPPPGRDTTNTVRVDIDPSASFDMEAMKRRKRSFFSSSSCGVCGIESLDALAVGGCSVLDPDHPKIDGELIHELPDRLRKNQPLFTETGGIHASALFGENGEHLGSGEDIGRHNAVDKVIGHQFLEGNTPLADTILVVSGRTSFEILQKAIVAGIPVIVAVGAPSTLAIDLANRFGMTLVGFTREQRYNIYSGSQRIGRPGPGETVR